MLNGLRTLWLAILGQDRISHQDESVEDIQARIRLRWHRAFDDLTRFGHIIVIYSAFFLSEYALIWLVEWLLREDAAVHPIVALWLDRAKILLALLLIVVTIVHGFRAAVLRVWMTSREA